MTNMPGTPDNLNLLREKNFKAQLTVSRLPTINFFCTGVGMPGYSVGAIERPGLNKHLPEPGNKLSQDPLTATFLVDEDAQNWLEIYNWLLGMTYPESFAKSQAWVAEQEKSLGEYHPYKSQLNVMALKNSMFPNINFTFHNAFPTNLTGLPFTSTGKDDTISATVTFVYTHMTYRKIKH